MSSKASPQYATILSVDLSSQNTTALNNELLPFAILTVRKSPAYKEQVNVNIEGEVIYPGSYSITSNQERLSDLLTRAGGIRESSYPKKMFILRSFFKNLTNNDSVILKNKIATLNAPINNSLKAKAADSTFK